MITNNSFKPSRYMIILFISLISMFFLIIFSLYDINLEHKGAELNEMGKNVVLRIESLAECLSDEQSIFKKKLSDKEVEKFIVTHLNKIYANSHSFDKTGEIVLVRFFDNNIELLLQNRFKSSNYDLQLANNKLFAESVMKALNGEPGVIIAKDYRGEKVLAAYRPFSGLNLGLMVKIDIKEIREPYIIAGIFAVILSLFIVFIGSLIYTKIKNPSMELLKRKENKYRGIFESATDMFFLLSNKHKIIDVNKSARKKYHFSEDQMLGKDFKELIFQKYHRQFTQTLITTFKGLEAKILSRHITSAGETFPVEVHITPILLEEDEALLVSVRDISKRVDNQKKNVKLEAQLSQSEKLASIGQLAAGVAHEINNPMGYINSNLNTMNKYIWKLNKFFSELEINSKERAEEIEEMMTDFGDAIAESLEGADRVKKIVADLKSFARTDNKFEFVNINEGIASTLNIVHNQLKYHCEVQEDLQDIPEVFCIRGKINQVIMNLLVNAGQSIKANGLIVIKTWSENEKVFISIKDNGIGIPKDKINQIYDPFYTSKEVGVGTGLGLSVVYDIIKKHEGTIDVISEVGVGTEFIITLPYRKDEEEEDDEDFTLNSQSNYL